MTIQYDRPAPVLAPGGPIGSGLRVPVGILGTGLHLPSRVVSNDAVSHGLDTSDAWIRARTGIRERRFVDPDLSTSDLCVAAAREALESSGTAPEELDAIILSTITADQPLPSTALVVAEALGAHRALPIDLNQAACAGGVYGILLAAHLLQGHLRRVLVIGAETMSRLTDPADRATRVFFGDAAGAAVLGPTLPGYGLLSWDVGSALSYGVEVKAGGSRRPTTEETAAAREQYLRMDGRAVWETATTAVPASVAAAVDRAGLRLDEVDHFFFHQANLVMLEAIRRHLDIPPQRAPMSVDRYGNTGAASIFTVLHPAVRDGRVGREDVMVISGIGAGFLWGTVCLRHC